MERKSDEAPAFKVKFWGVRGSVPSPMDPACVEEKILRAVSNYAALARPYAPENFVHALLLHERGTYGGNTSCVEICAGASEKRIVLDMGTGARNLGNSLLAQALDKDGLDITFLLSHASWDLMQGLPFFAPFYLSKYQGIHNHWRFYGAKGWQEETEKFLACQAATPPMFPISWQEIKKITTDMETSDLDYMMSFYPSFLVSLQEIQQITTCCEVSDVYDGMSLRLDDSGVLIRARELDELQKIYGWRLKYQGKIIAHTTDNASRNELISLESSLMDLVEDADLWITNYQYARPVCYRVGNDVPRYGWEYPYPEAIANIAAKANVKRVVLFRHDPSSSDEEIYAMENSVRASLEKHGCRAIVHAAYEGLEIMI